MKNKNIGAAVTNHVITGRPKSLRKTGCGATPRGAGDIASVAAVPFIRIEKDIINKISVCTGISMKELTKPIPDSPEYINNFYKRYRKMCIKQDRERNKIRKIFQDRVGRPIMESIISELIKMGNIF
jgi:hypothetical protein